MIIKDIFAHEILDSRGNPTVETTVRLENGVIATASVPSGASTGVHEALELRDKDEKRYHGQGVLKAVENVNTVIKNALVGKPIEQNKIDDLLLKLDGTEFKTNLGANAILSVSLACLKAGAMAHNKELYEYVSTGRVTMPIPMMNIINGGKHADSGLDIQEFMIVPVVKEFKERLRAGSEIFHTLKGILKSMKLNVSVGDEGGFAPRLDSNEQAIALIVDAIEKSGYVPGKDVFVALDCAATSMYDEVSQKYTLDGKQVTADELANYYVYLTEKYPIISIEDPFFEEDFKSFETITTKLGDKIMLVGDDYFVTNKEFLRKGIEMGAGNAVLLKANQIGTITEMIETIMLAKRNNYKMVISHRSGETMDTFISDLAVGLAIPYIKAGSLSRGERIAKYNRLVTIEENLKK
ncbi:MAG: phosphopyruvate hydratase [Firmicutes bacterium]|nr:phosphopyruvate hydratase [Bacillota bacterium]